MKTVIVKGAAGMGNRMLCAASGILWAKAIGREVYIDWRDPSYSSNKENSFFYFFENQSIMKYPPLKDKDIFPEIWYNHEDVSMRDMLSTYDPDKFNSFIIHKKYSVNPRNIECQNNIVVFWHYIGFFEIVASIAQKKLSEFKKSDIKHIVKKVMRDNFVLTKNIKDLINSYKSQNWDANMIGVHVRYTDRKISLNKINHYIQRQTKNMKEYVIFLCTDNKEIEKLFINKYKKVVCTKKWFPNNGLTMHNNNLCPDPIQNGIEALVDMYLLSQCDVIIHSSRSTFSQVSCIMSELPAEKIIDIDSFNISDSIKNIARKLLT